ncbi:hypothetical protein [Cupriavidus numazuensis]|uniref:TMhelix containing protein n=1 Tax=Cupriavidus numazuensis TaxID=221992 RepID=A0ABN7QC77_9BURK|nr:hypothetical protein [Cupriavidus numazuensis]CAG2159716.1 hypothetical protein LMG26411_06920 [Cupriavidus numazuensis]
MEFFGYLKNTHDINVFVFAVLIGWCVWEAGLVLLQGLRRRPRKR